MILVPEDRYESLLFIDTKKLPVALHLQHNDVLMTSESRKTGFYGFWMKIGKLFKISPKILGICDFDGVFQQVRKEITIITYT